MRSKGKRQTVEAEVDSPLRIIGGKFRGRKLQYSGRHETRPMKHRVREAIFNLVGPPIKGMHAVDLFAGTGALGLEAISRGAATATLIERHFPTADIIKANAASLDLESECDVVVANTFLWTKKITFAADPPWVVFCSPPYDFYVERADDMQALISEVLEAAPAESMIVVEADERFDAAMLPEPDEWDVRVYAPAVVAIRRLRSPTDREQKDDE